jgi:hypothetical protein
MQTNSQARIKELMMSRSFNENFRAFLAAWVRHDDLRNSGSIAELASSRFELDELRYRTWASI